MKIKTKKELTLPELLEWAWKNDVEFEHFYGSRKTTVYFGSDSTITMNGYVQPDETFAVEVEKKITEDSVIPRLVEIYEVSWGNNIVDHRNKSIKNILERNKRYEHILAKRIFMLNDDYSFTLLWKNGAMVE